MASTTVNFNLKTAGYVNYANQTLTFRLLTLGAEASTGDQSYVTLPGVVTATSAANGDGSVSLFRNGKSGIESVYEVILPNREKAKFIIPSGSATIELATLLVDHVPGGTNVQQSSVYAEAIKRANHTGTQLLSTISDAATVQLKPSEGAFANGDKTKLNGIETGATTDQTNAEIRAAVEAATDSNVFTDDDHTKLNSIAGSTTEEIQDIAGALVATGGTKTGIAVTYDDANNNMDFVVASQTDENFTTADHAKLDSITLPAGAGTTINPFARDSLLNSNAASIKGALAIPDTGAIAGFVPNSITLPSTSDFLSLATSADLNVGTSDFTLSFWARLDGSGTEPILNKYSGAGYSLKFSSGSLILLIQGTGDPLSVTLATGLNDNKWHVYVVSVDRNGNAVAYVDNIAQTAVSVSTVQSSLDNTTAFRIGYDGANASSDIAFGNYVVLYKSALDSTQAGKIYFSADTALTVETPTLMVDLRKATETFLDVSSSPLPVITNGTVRFNQDRLTEFTGTNVLATTTLGYTTGSGGTVSQGTNKGTTVALNKATGQITLNGAALAANTGVTFALTNSTIVANDILVFNHVSGGTIGAYNFNAVAGSGTATVTVRNITGGSLSEAPVISFAVIKAVTS